MSWDDNVVVFRWDGAKGSISKKEVVEWIYRKYFNITQTNYDFEQYLFFISKQKPHTQLSIIKWVINNILSV